MNNSQPAASPPVALTTGIAVGDPVISWYDDDTVEYGGPGDGGPWTTLTFAVFAGGLPVRRCEPQRVAPTATAISDRDDRISVQKRPRCEMPYGASGPWRLSLPSVTHPSWHRTKRDAIATGLRRLAILDWHATNMPTA